MNVRKSTAQEVVDYFANDNASLQRQITIVMNYAKELEKRIKQLEKAKPQADGGGDGKA